MRAVAAEYSEALGRTITYVDVPMEEWRERELRPLGLPDHVFDHITTMAQLHADNRYDRLPTTSRRSSAGPRRASGITLRTTPRCSARAPARRDAGSGDDPDRRPDDSTQQLHGRPLGQHHRSRCISRRARGTRAAVADLSREQLVARPIPGKWSVLELLCHLADTDANIAHRLKRVLSEERPEFERVQPDLMWPRSCIRPARPRRNSRSSTSLAGRSPAYCGPHLRRSGDGRGS